jgi:plastocyanin
VTYSHVFTEPGEYPYYCTAHGTKTRGMIGKIVVTG